MEFVLFIPFSTHFSTSKNPSVHAVGGESQDSSVTDFIMDLLAARQLVLLEGGSPQFVRFANPPMIVLSWTTVLE